MKSAGGSWSLELWSGDRMLERFPGWFGASDEAIAVGQRLAGTWDRRGFVVTRINAYR